MAVQGKNVAKAPFLNACIYISVRLLESGCSQLKMLHCYTPSQKFRAALPNVCGRPGAAHPRQAKVVRPLDAENAEGKYVRSLR